MKPKEKAKELIEKFGDIGIYIKGPRCLDICINQTSDALETKKEGALIIVNELISCFDVPFASSLMGFNKNYYLEVKQEIQNL